MRMRLAVLGLVGVLAVAGVAAAQKETRGVTPSEIERVNKQLARVETIKKFRLIEQLLTAEDEELTPTMKLKRTFVNRKYKDVIDGMYVEM